MLCDYKYLILGVSIGHSGNSIDSTKLINLFILIKNLSIYPWIHHLPYRCFVLGDSGFGITPQMMTPYAESKIAYDSRRGYFNYDLVQHELELKSPYGHHKLAHYRAVR